MSRWIAVAALALGLATAAPCARAVEPHPHQRKVGYALKPEGLWLAFGFRDAFTPAVRKKLTSGLPVHIAVRIQVEDKNHEVVGQWMRTTTIVYDLWSERFRITVRTRSNVHTTQVESEQEAIDRAGVFKGIAGPIPSVTPIRVRVFIEVNPVSPDTIADIRRWMSRSRDSVDMAASSSNVFGQFASYLVDRRIGQADKVLLFVSQWLRP